MTKSLSKQFKTASGLFTLLFLPCAALAQEAIAPPSLGQETKGSPTIVEEQSSSTQTAVETVEQESTEQNTEYGLLGHTEANEQRRENGHIYRIELKHSSGSTQYIDEDSEGKLEPNNDDIGEAPNLAKWRIGSW